MIRTALLGLALACISFAAHADTSSESTSTSTSGAQTATHVNNALTLQTQQLRETSVKAAPGHGLAATTNSFSSDYCGGTTQVGGSGMGFSVGASTQTFDENCQALRRAQSFGQQSTHFANMALELGNRPANGNGLSLIDVSIRLALLSSWEVCRSNETTAEACASMDLLGGSDD